MSSRTPRASGWRRSSVSERLFRLKLSKKSESVPFLVRRHVARDVAADRGILDLDHLGAEVGELHRPERAGTVLLDRDDADIGERLHGRLMPAARPRAATTVAIFVEASSIISPSNSTAPVASPSVAAA